MTPRDYLASLEFHGVKLGLDNIRALMCAAGDPNRAYSSIHVAGTNGKGSVVAFIDAILRAAGYRVGRFTSPHLINVNERFIVDSRPIDDNRLDALLDRFRLLAEPLSHPPTYFEMCTAVAFQHFADERVDAAVIEVGMGGRFDSTNIIEPTACVITNIAMDHAKYLGDTLEKIAFEKAGIIKRAVPVVVGERPGTPFDVIAARARDVGAATLLPERDFEFAPTGAPLEPALDYRGKSFVLTEAPLGLAGRHQIENAALAVACIELLRNTFPAVNRDAVLKGLRDARWPCRLERVLARPPVYIDVAHNPAGVARLTESLTRCHVVFSVSNDKDAAEMLRRIAGISATLILTAFHGPRAMPLDMLRLHASSIPHETRTSLEDAIDAGIERATADVPLLIVGSIFAAGQARRYLTDRYGASPPTF